MSNREALASVALDCVIGLLSLIVALVSVDCSAAPVYVANGGFPGTLVAVDSSSGIARVTPLVLGYSPRAVAVSPSNDRVYAVNSNSGSNPLTAGSVSVVSVADWHVIATLQVGSSANSAAVSPNGNQLFVVSSLSSGSLRGTLWAIDTTTHAVRSLNVGTSARGVAIDPADTLVYVVSAIGVEVISAATLAPLYAISLQASGDSGANYVAVSSDGRYLYVTQPQTFTGGDIVIIDTTTREVVRRIPVFGLPDTLALSHDGQRLYVGLRSGTNSVAVISTAETRVVTYVPLGSIVNGLALTADDRELWVMLNNAQLVAIETQTLAVARSLSFPTGTASRGNFIGPRNTPSGTAPVVEFYHRDLDHYFITQDAGEIRALDRGTQSGWARTGQSFFAFPPASATSGQPVCRYYGLPAAGLNSHFYSASAAECAAVGTQFAGAWSLEANDVFSIAVPSSVGECPAGTEPVYRVWNNRRDSNHRYMMNAGIRDAMVAKGYIAEGYGPQGVAMCGVAAQ